MNDEKTRNRMMDYLYDEMSPQQKKDFEAFLQTRPELRLELEELVLTRQLLQSAPAEIPAHKLVVMPSSDKGSGNSPVRTERSSIRRLNPAVKTVFAVAASILIFLAGASFTDLKMGKTEAGFYLTFGSEPVQQTAGISEEQVYRLIEQMKNEQSLMLAGMMEQVQQQQNEQLSEVLTVLADYYDRRREQDLQMIANGFYQLEEQTNYRLTRTNETLGSLIYALSNPQ
jgi:hypothetical protein